MDGRTEEMGRRTIFSTGGSAETGDGEGDTDGGGRSISGWSTSIGSSTSAKSSSSYGREGSMDGIEVGIDCAITGDAGGLSERRPAASACTFGSKYLHSTFTRGLGNSTLTRDRTPNNVLGVELTFGIVHADEQEKQISLTKPSLTTWVRFSTPQLLWQITRCPSGLVTLYPVYRWCFPPCERTGRCIAAQSERNALANRAS